MAEAPRGVGGLLFASVQLVGSLIVLRYMLPAFPDQCDQWAPFLRGLASVGLLLAAWKATRATDRFELATQLGIASSQLAVLSFFTLQTAGIVGGLLVVLAHSSAAVLIEPLGCLTHVPASRRTHPTKFLASSIAEGTDTQSQLANRSGSGLAADSRPIDRLLGLLVVASLMGLPGLAGFTGLMLASTAIFLTSMTPLLIAWIAVIVLGSVLWQASGALRPNSAVESPPERFTLLPAAVMLVWLGVMPAILIARVTPVVERITSDPDDQTAILLEDRPNSVEIASKGGISAWP